MREGLGDPYRYLLPADISALEADAQSRFRTIAPRLAFSGLISKGDDTLSFVGEGIDPQRCAGDPRHHHRRRPRPDRSAPCVGAARRGSCGQSGGTARRPGGALASSADGGIKAVELEVAGLFATITKAYDDTVLRAPIDIARQLMRVEGATSWVLLLDDTEATAHTLAKLTRRLPADRFEIIPWYGLADFYNKTVTLFSRQVGVVRILIALIVVLSISNTLSMAVIERTGEIGTAMALGVRPRGILTLFLAEGALLGLVGGAIGVLAGHALGALVSAIGIPMPPPGMARGYIGQIAISPALALDAFLLAFLTTLVASIFPAWKASRMNIVDALRHQR